MSQPGMRGGVLGNRRCCIDAASRSSSPCSSNLSRSVRSRITATKWRQLAGPAVPHRRDRLLGDEELAALLAVDHGRLERRAAGDRLPERAVELGLLPAGLEQARRGAHGLGSGVAGGRLERRVHVLDAARPVGDEHAVGGLLEGVGETLRQLLGVLLLGDVAKHRDPAEQLPAAVEDRRRRDARPCLGGAGHAWVAHQHVGLGDVLAAHRPDQRQLVRREEAVGVRLVEAVRSRPLGDLKAVTAPAAGETAGRVVDEEDRTVRAGHQDPLGDAVDHRSHQVVVAPQLLLPVPRLGEDEQADDHLVAEEHLDSQGQGAVVAGERQVGEHARALARLVQEVPAQRPPRARAAPARPEATATVPGSSSRRPAGHMSRNAARGKGIPLVSSASRPCKRLIAVSPRTDFPIRRPWWRPAGR